MEKALAEVYAEVASLEGPTLLLALQREDAGIQTLVPIFKTAHSMTLPASASNRD